MLVGAGTSFEAGSSNSIAFEKTLTIHEGAEADIESRHISIDELKFHGNGGLASLAVLPEGSLSFSRPVTVKDGAKLNISLEKNSRLTGAVFPMIRRVPEVPLFPWAREVFGKTPCIPTSLN